MAKRAAPTKPPVVPGRKKRARSTSKFKPTDEQRQNVEALISVGVPVEVIAKVMKIPKSTLRRNFVEQISHGLGLVHARVGGSIANMALNGDKTMLIFYAKTQMGWRERHALGFEDDKGLPTNPPGAVYTVSIT